MGHRTTGTGRATENGNAIAISGTDPHSSEIMASGLYWFYWRLWELQLQFLVAADDAVDLGGELQYRSGSGGNDPKSPWRNRDDLFVAPLPPGPGEAGPPSNARGPYGGGGAASCRAALAIVVSRSPFRGRYRYVQLLAGFHFDTGRILDRLCGRRRHRAGHIGLEHRRFRRPLYFWTHSPADWQLVLRPDLCGNSLSYLSDNGIDVAQASFSSLLNNHLQRTEALSTGVSEIRSQRQQVLIDVFFQSHPDE